MSQNKSITESITEDKIMKIKYPTKTYSLIQLMDGKMAQEIILEGQ
jgi:hypothetical protein